MTTFQGDKKIHIQGDPFIKKYIEETIYNYDITVDSNYVIGLWVNGDVTPSKYNGVSYNDRAYGLEVELYDSSSNLVGYHYFPFDSFVEEWQYVVNEFYVGASVSSIKIRAVFQGEGNVYLDGFQLYQQSLGTKYEYDTVGNLIEVAQPDSAGEISYDYQSGTLYVLDSITDQNGVVIDYSYDSQQLFSNLKYNNVTSGVIRDGNNQVTSVRIGEDNDDDGEVGDQYQDSYYVNFTTYTSDGQYVSQTKNEFAATIDYETNLLNGLLESFDNEMNVTTTYQYDEKGRVVQVSKDSSNNYYVYVDDRLDEIQVNGITYKLFYDSYDRLDEVKVGSGTGGNFAGNVLRQFVYNQDGVDTNSDGIDDTFFVTSRISEEIFGNNDGIKFTYNDEKQVAGVWFKTCETCSYIQRYQYEYNQVGDIAVVKDLRDDNEFYYDYDLMGRVEKITSEDGDVIRYEYDNAGNLYVYSFDIQGYSRNVTYDYDVSNDMYDKTEYTLDNNDEFTKNYSFESDQLRRLTGITITLVTPANITTTLNTISYTYVEGYGTVTYGNVSNRLLTLTQVFDGVTHTETIDYDNQGYITKITNQNGKEIEYYYDDKGQLVRENNEVDGFTMIFAYDNYGNRTSVSEYSYQSGNGSLGTPSEYTRFDYNNTWADQISQVVVYDMSTYSVDYTISYYYDNAGNLTSTVDSRSSYLNQTVSWEGRSLLSYSKYGTSASYTYDQNGVRDSKTVNGVTTTFYLDGTKVVYETDGTNEIYYTYDFDGSLISMNYNGSEYYYVFNVLGDVTHLLDSSGNVVVEYRYDSYGNLDDSITLTGVGLANPYRYRSYRFDNETGFYYLQSRYYNPETGRFISSDALMKSSGSVLGHNMYAYCNNNPVMLTDSTGYAPEWLNPSSWNNETKIAVGIIIIAALAIATIATGGAAGGVAGYILSGALNGAVMGALSTGLISGTINGLSTGTWEGFANGFANGFLTGAVIGGVTGAATNTFRVARAAQFWDKGTYSSRWASMANHYQRKVVGTAFQTGNNVVNYTDDAIGFMSRNGNSFSMLRGGEGLQHVWTLGRGFGSGANGLYTASGKIISYSYWFIS